MASERKPPDHAAYTTFGNIPPPPPPTCEAGEELVNGVCVTPPPPPPPTCEAGEELVNGVCVTPPPPPPPTCEAGEELVNGVCVTLTTTPTMPEAAVVCLALLMIGAGARQLRRRVA